MPLLEVNNLKKVYTTRFGGAHVQALSNVSFSVEKGEYVAIMGESGSGKTTLLNILASLDKPTSGEVLLNGRSLSAIGEREISAFRRDNLGFVFQDFHLLDTFTLKDNIFLPLVLSGRRYEEMEQRLAPIARHLGIEKILEKYPYEVSGGQKQRVAVARALIIKPQIVLADEPTGALDYQTGKAILKLLQDTCRQKKMTVIVITHEMRVIDQICDRVAVIDHHRKGVGFIENPALVCHEPYSSSASELVTELLQYVGTRDDKPNRVEAEGLLSGIMLDTRDFTLHTGVRTFEAAAALRRYGAETERVRQLFDVTMVEYNAKAALVEAAQMYKGCAISVGSEVAPEARVAVAQAANDLLTIQGVDASFVAVPVGTGVNVSARSLGAVNVQVIMESLGGGGHQTMAAAQLKHITPEAARARIQTAIDQYRESQKKSAPDPKK